MNDKSDFFIVLIVAIFASWLFFPDFDGKDSITAYSISKPHNCSTKKECKIVAGEYPTVYTVNKSQKEIYYRFINNSNKNIIKLTNCDIINVKNWECRIENNKEILIGLDKMIDGIVVRSDYITSFSLIDKIVQYVPKWKWKLVKYFGYQPEIKGSFNSEELKKLLAQYEYLKLIQKINSNLQKNSDSTIKPWEKDWRKHKIGKEYSKDNEAK